MTARVLTETEAQALRETVERVWAWSGYYFHPLHKTSRTDVIGFDARWLEARLPDESFRSLLAAHGITEVKWWCEHEPSELVSLTDFRYFRGYGFSETFIVDDVLDWIVYWSHEETVTFGGERLIALMKSRVPDWADGVW